MATVSEATSPKYRALLQLLKAADAIWEASRKFFAQWDLSPSQFNVLNLLHLNPDGLSQTDLSRFLIVHRSNVTGLVDRLEKRGLVQRKVVEADRRAYRVVLSPAGQKLLSQILPRYYQSSEEVWGHLANRRTRELISDLEQVAQSAQRLSARFKPQTI